MFYGWAEKNTLPEIPSNEKGRRNKLNGMISVDVSTGKEYLKLKEKSKTFICFRVFHTIPSFFFGKSIKIYLTVKVILFILYLRVYIYLKIVNKYGNY